MLKIYFSCVKRDKPKNPQPISCQYSIPILPDFSGGTEIEHWLEMG